MAAAESPEVACHVHAVLTAATDKLDELVSRLMIFGLTTCSTLQAVSWACSESTPSTVSKNDVTVFYTHPRPLS